MDLFLGLNPGTPPPIGRTNYVQLVSETNWLHVELTYAYYYSGDEPTTVGNQGALILNSTILNKSCGLIAV